MSVYCTVEEAWGGNFGGKGFFKPSLLKNEEDPQYIEQRDNFGREKFSGDNVSNRKEHIKGGKEGFSNLEDWSKKPKIFTSGSQKVYQPGEEYVHSSNKYRHFRLRPQDDQNEYSEENARLIPKSYDTDEYSGYGGSAFYDYNTDCANPNNRSLNFDYTNVEGESQLMPNPYPEKYRETKKYCPNIDFKDSHVDFSDTDLCDNVSLHIVHCKACQDSVTRIIKKAKELQGCGSNNTEGKTTGEDGESEASEDSETNELDVTEIILFVLCGVFFIFLLDSIIAIGQRFR